MNSVNATHILDIIGGGDPRKLSVGDAAINQLIGPQWNLNNRAGTLWEEAEKMQAAGLGDMKMEHISLNACK